MWDNYENHISQPAISLSSTIYGIVRLAQKIKEISLPSKCSKVSTPIGVGTIIDIGSIDLTVNNRLLPDRFIYIFVVKPISTLLRAIALSFTGM